MTLRTALCIGVAGALCVGSADALTLRRGQLPSIMSLLRSSSPTMPPTTPPAPSTHTSIVAVQPRAASPQKFVTIGVSLLDISKLRPYRSLYEAASVTVNSVDEYARLLKYASDLWEGENVNGSPLRDWVLSQASWSMGKLDAVIKFEAILDQLLGDERSFVVGRSNAGDRDKVRLTVAEHWGVNAAGKQMIGKHHKEGIAAQILGGSFTPAAADRLIKRYDNMNIMYPPQLLAADARYAALYAKAWYMRGMMQLGKL